MIGVPLLLFLLLPAEEPIKPKFPLGKDTTFVMGPLDKEEYVVYEAALNERLRKGVTPETNANVLIWKAIGPRPEHAPMPAEYFKTLGIAAPPDQGDYFISMADFLRDYLKLKEVDWTAISDEQSLSAKRPWAAKDRPHMASWLAANEKPLTIIIEATKRPAYFNPLVPMRPDKGPGLLISASLASAQTCREVTLALAARAMLRVGEGKYEAAWQDLLACHRLARLVGGGATNIEALIGIALNATVCNADLAFIGNSRLTSQQARDCLRGLGRLPPKPPLAEKMDLGERFICLDALQSIQRGMYAEMGGKAGKQPDQKGLAALGSIDWAPTLRKANKTYDRLSAAMRIPDRPTRAREMEKIGHELDDEVKATRERNASVLGKLIQLAEILKKPEDTGKKVGKSIGDVAMGMLMPAAEKVQNAVDRSMQVQQNVQVAFALAAYRADTGRYPAKLDELAPKYLAAIPGDLFSGKSLIYRPSASGYLLYSVGPNGVDDGGRLYDDDPPGDDIGVRMPPPELKAKNGR